MTLMGFKDSSFLKVYHNINHSMFVIPDEKKSAGSSACVDALLQEMLTKDKIALVKFRPKADSQPVFAALEPQKADGTRPAGFTMIQIPYADDLRDNKKIMEASAIDANADVVGNLKDEEKNAAKLLIKNLDFDFDSRDFRNQNL